MKVKHQSYDICTHKQNASFILRATSYTTPRFSSGTAGDVLSFSETRAQSLVNHRTEEFLAFNQRQLSRIYPSAYRIDSSNFNPQFYWNVGCQLGKMTN